MRHQTDPGRGGRIAVLCGALLTIAVLPTVGVSEEAPLPPPRPVDTGPKPPPVPAPAAPETAPVPSSEVSPIGPASCPERLRAAGFGLEAAETPKTENGLCRIDVPVRLLSVPVPSQPEKRIVLKEKPILACVFAESLGHWLGDLVAPVIAGRLGGGLQGVQTGPGFECRNRNRSANGKLSAHAEGRAIDISQFELADGSKLGIKPGNDERRAGTIAVLRRAACGWFTTILGPGSDPSHADHLHVDIQMHGSSDRYRICE